MIIKEFIYNKKIVLGTIIFVVIFLLWFFSQISGFRNGKNKVFEIKSGQGVNEISRNLKLGYLIKNSFIFETYVWLKKKEKDFKAGEYILNTGMNLKEITRVLTSGKAISQEREIKIIEGWNLEDIVSYLESENIIDKEEFLEAAKREDVDNLKKYEFLFSSSNSKDLEGFLFPDTYRIYKNAEAQDIVLKMLDNFNKKLTPKMREEIKKQGKSIYDIIIMASIIQKEVPAFEDMKLASDIFWRRIKKGIPLQSCATIAYILGVSKKQYSYEDTRVESSYNTYINYGLPPAPICNPGIAAIEAAIYPQANEYWYFLSNSENGETVFSKTLDEHNKNKAKYLGN